MGARVNFVIKTDDNMPNINLYSHWGETTWRLDLANAIDKAFRRIAMEDISYSARIIISQLIKEEWDLETGFGISLVNDKDIENFVDEVVIVDLVNNRVNDSGNWHSFDSFVEYQREVEENHVGV